LANDDEEQWISILNIYSITREKDFLYIQHLNGEKTYSRWRKKHTADNLQFMLSAEN
jgi:hypothetical protein